MQRYARSLIYCLTYASLFWIVTAVGQDATWCTAEEVRVPFQIAEEGAPVIVSASIGENSYQLLIDTGAGNASFDSSVKRDLSPALRLALGARGGIVELATMHRAPTITVEGVQLRSAQDVACTPFLEKKLERLTGEKLSGDVGLGYLGDDVVTFDFDLHEMILSQQIPDQQANTRKIPFVIRDQKPYVSIMIDGIELEALIDFGGIGSISVDTKVFDHLTKRRDGQERVGVYCDMLKMGGVEEQKRYIIADNINALGLYFWMDYTLTFDFVHKCLFLTPRAARSVVDHSAMDGACCELVQIIKGAPKKIGVCAIPGSLAERQGLKLGDLLIKINDMNADELGLLRVDRLWSRRGRKAVKVVVLRNGLDDDKSNDQEITILFPPEETDR